MSREQEERERQMMGCTFADLQRGMPPIIDPLLYAMGILSDAQELLRTGGDPESIRQFINRAKCLMGEELKKRSCDRR